MESQSSSKRIADQLQSVALQDKAVQSRTNASLIPQGNVSESPYKIVIRSSNGPIKGYADAAQWEFSGNGDCSCRKTPGSLSLKRLDSNKVEDISLVDIKAVFFVRDFLGEAHHADLRFHDHLPAMECLWVRVRFSDGEMVEGMINNTREFVLQSGFFMVPADPLGNNWLIYVLKSKLTDFEILGLRPKVKTLSLFNTRT